MGVNSLPKTVTQQCRGCDLNPGPSAPESSVLTTRLPSHPDSHPQSKKVKFSHTRYRALGPELIPVYRQSARR